MTEHEEKRLKSLDALEALLTSPNRSHYGEIQNILELFKKEAGYENTTHAQIVKYLDDLVKLGTVKEHKQYYAPSKYECAEKHPIGHHQEAVNAETEKNKGQKKQIAIDEQIEKDNCEKRFDVRLSIATKISTLILFACSVIGNAYQFCEKAEYQTKSEMKEQTIKRLRIHLANCETLNKTNTRKLASQNK